MRALVFATGEYYHVYNRAVEKRTIFVDDRDYRKFLNSFVQANRRSQRIEDPDWLKPLVGCVAYAIMPNHYHFLFRQEVDGGISKLMHRLGTSYGTYFNKKYAHEGRVIAATFKAKIVESQSYLQWLIRYIHMNPIDLFVGDPASPSALTFLSEYPWSSMKGYVTKRVDPILNAPLYSLLSMDDYKDRCASPSPLEAKPV